MVQHRRGAQRDAGLLIYIASPYSEQTVCNGLQTPSSLNIPETVLARKHWHYSLTLSLVFE